MDEYLTIREVRDLLKVSDRTVRRWIERGNLPALKIGRSVRIRRADIDRPAEAHSPLPETKGQLAVLARARQLRHRLDARHCGPAGNAVEILRDIRLERAHAR